MDEGRTASSTPAVLELRVQGRKRLVLLLATVMIMIVALAGLGIRQLQELTRRLTEIAEDYVPITVAVTEIDLLQHKQAIQLEQSLRLGEAVNRGEVLAPSFDNSAGVFDRLSIDIERKIGEAEELTEELGTSNASEATGKEFRRIGERLAEVRQQHVSYVDRAEGMFLLLEMGQLADARSLAEEIQWEVGEINRDLDQLRSEVRVLAVGSLQEIRADERDSIWALSILAGLTLAAGAATLVVGLRSLVRAERQLREYTH